MIFNNYYYSYYYHYYLYYNSSICYCQKTKHVAEDKMGPYLTLLCLNGDGAEAVQLSVLSKAWRAAS